MKKLALLPLILLSLLACKENGNVYRLEGTYGNGNDTLLIFGFDDRHDRTDTVVTDETGTFGYSLETDTIVPLTMLLPDGKLLQIYAEAATVATMHPDSLNRDEYTVTGGTMQMLYDSIRTRIDSIEDKAAIYEEIDSFIKKHPYSDVNLQLLMKYFVEVEEPKNAFIRERIEAFGGTLQDNEHIIDLKERTARGKGNVAHRAFPASQIKVGENVKDVPRCYNDKYFIITFWASWDSASIDRMRMLRDIKALKDTACIALLNISLDHDTAAWKRRVEADSIPGDNICDTKMWNNSIAEQFVIDKLPFSILVNPYQRVDKFGITNKFIEESSDSLVDKVKDNRKKRAEREAKQKREEARKNKRK